MHDYHMHSRFCRHAVGALEEYARSARDKGLDEICFTPHIPIPGFRPGFLGDRLRMDEAEFDGYLEELERTRRRFPDLAILSGIEADYIDGIEPFLERFLSSHPFDFVLMSVHFIAAWPEDEWVFGFSQRRPLLDVYRDYFRAMRSGMETGLFDSVAHLDLIKQPGSPVLDVCRDEVEEVLDLCARRGMAVEINTSGARKGIGETYPCDDIIRLLLDRRIPLTPGSDAHDPSQVGFFFEELVARHGRQLSESLVRYRQRRMLGRGNAAVTRGDAAARGSATARGS